MAANSTSQIDHTRRSTTRIERQFGRYSRLGGLLSHNIRIVSEGDTAPVAPQYRLPFLPPTDGSVGYFFGGHTIVRQGFSATRCRESSFIIWGRAARSCTTRYTFTWRVKRPRGRRHRAATFVKDSSVWDSMTRWMVIHATQGVRLARNVGYDRSAMATIWKTEPKRATSCTPTLGFLRVRRSLTLRISVGFRAS